MARSSRGRSASRIKYSSRKDLSGNERTKRRRNQPGYPQAFRVISLGVLHDHGIRLAVAAQSYMPFQICNAALSSCIFPRPTRYTGNFRGEIPRDGHPLRSVAQWGPKNRRDGGKGRNRCVISRLGYSEARADFGVLVAEGSFVSR